MGRGLDDDDRIREGDNHFVTLMKTRATIRGLVRREWPNHRALAFGHLLEQLVIFRGIEMIATGRRNYPGFSVHLQGTRMRRGVGARGATRDDNPACLRDARCEPA